MSSMVGKVARAICFSPTGRMDHDPKARGGAVMSLERDCKCTSPDECEEMAGEFSLQPELEAAARAAIEALMEPTEGMLRAVYEANIFVGEFTINEGEGEEVFRIMLTEALKDSSDE